MTFEDSTGRTIQIGDILLYTMSTDGSAAKMRAGKVTRFSPQSIWVQPADLATLNPQMVDEYYMVDDGPPKVYYPGTASEWTHQLQRRVITGKTEINEHNIPKPRPYRFLHS